LSFIDDNDGSTGNNDVWFPMDMFSRMKRCIDSEPCSSFFLHVRN